MSVQVQEPQQRSYPSPSDAGNAPPNGTTAAERSVAEGHSPATAHGAPREGCA